MATRLKKGYRRTPPQGRDLADIGAELGLCRERVRQIMESTLRKIAAKLDITPDEAEVQLLVLGEIDATRLASIPVPPEAAERLAAELGAILGADHPQAQIAFCRETIQRGIRRAP